MGKFFRPRSLGFAKNKLAILSIEVPA